MQTFETHQCKNFAVRKERTLIMISAPAVAACTSCFSETS